MSEDIGRDKQEYIEKIIDNANRLQRFAESILDISKIESKTLNLKKSDVNLATVRIEDNGSGIDAEIMPRLFSKFATNSSSDTGLGLFISKSILRLMVAIFGLRTTPVAIEKERYLPLEYL